MSTLAEKVAREFGSPAVMIDLDRVEANIARLQAACDGAGLRNRPHIKTHKSPVLAKLQIEAGARGLTCQTLGEAEVMTNAGLSDLLVSYNLVGAHKLGRLAALLRRTALTVSADHPAVVVGLAEAAAGAGRPLDVVVECDTGRGRAGVTRPAEVVALARAIAQAPSLRFAGLLLYPPEGGVAATNAFLDAVRPGLAEAGLEPGIVSTGGTPNLRDLGAVAGATEHRSGTSIFNDRMMMACGAARLEDCALDVVATVVSRATATRGVLDAGSKTLTADPGGGLDGHGLIREYPQARIGKLAEEHGFLDLSACPAAPEVGTVVRVVPNHVCVVVNMVDRLVATKGGRIVGEIPVAARGLTG